MHRAVPAGVSGGFIEHPERFYTINEILCEAAALNLRIDRAGMSALDGREA